MPTRLYWGLENSPTATPGFDLYALDAPSQHSVTFDRDPTDSSTPPFEVQDNLGAGLHGAIVLASFPEDGDHVFSARANPNGTTDFAYAYIHLHDSVDSVSGNPTESNLFLLDHGLIVGGGEKDSIYTQTADPTTAVTTVFGNGGDDQIWLSGGTVTAHGGAGNDAIIINDDTTIGTTHLLGEGGDDAIFGGHGADLIAGGKGDDLLFAGEGNDRLNGGLGNDHLEGGAGRDRLVGGSGDDFLQGDTGADILTGGAGMDTFSFRPEDSGVGGANHDVITDFNEAEDKLSFAFNTFDHFVAGAHHFSGAAGELIYVQNQPDTGFVRGDLNGDHVADFEIAVHGTHLMTAYNFEFQPPPA